MATLKVLIIEDAQVDQLILLKQLGNYQCSVTTVETAEAALELYKTGNNFDLLLVDWHLPGTDGIDFIGNIRSQNSNIQPKILMITGESCLDKINTAIDAGVDEYLMKPIDPEAFKEKLKLVGIESQS